MILIPRGRTGSARRDRGLSRRQRSGGLPLGQGVFTVLQPSLGRRGQRTQRHAVLGPTWLLGCRQRVPAVVLEGGPTGRVLEIVEGIADWRRGITP